MGSSSSQGTATVIVSAHTGTTSRTGTVEMCIRDSIINFPDRFVTPFTFRFPDVGKTRIQSKEMCIRDRIKEPLA